MNHFPLSDLERDACLLEDVVADARDAWALAKASPVTPRSAARLTAILSRLHEVADQNTALRVEIHGLLQAVDKEANR